VQALLEWVNSGEARPGPILWVAQTDELCEQATQTFREVWSAIGTRGELSVGRLWAGNHVSEAAASADRFAGQVVVATISKLGVESVSGSSTYDWLREASVVVIDEAHQATVPAYTQFLHWAGTGVRGKDRRPLLGLTATPFRSGEQATERLITRFGRRLIQIARPDDTPEDRWDVDAHLREIGVLARATHRELEGVEITLDDEQVRVMRGDGKALPSGWLPRDVEARIGENAARNRTIIAAVESLPETWPVLLFAASVRHAQALAALLTLRGIPSAAVSADTAPGARHHYIDRFKRGDLRVLTNFGVLTTGFDAPGVKAIFITRPTFSRGLYMQMVGRGLRGPLNGGKDRCLIVDVADNIERFDGTLAYKELAGFWERDDHGGAPE